VRKGRGHPSTTCLLNPSTSTSTPDEGRITRFPPPVSRSPSVRRTSASRTRVHSPAASPPRCSSPAVSSERFPFRPFHPFRPVQRIPASASGTNDATSYAVTPPDLSSSATASAVTATLLPRQMPKSMPRSARCLPACHPPTPHAGFGRPPPPGLCMHKCDALMASKCHPGPRCWPQASAVRRRDQGGVRGRPLQQVALNHSAIQFTFTVPIVAINEFTFTVPIVAIDGRLLVFRTNSSFGGLEHSMIYDGTSLSKSRF
jgi:hypothetical protein